MIFSLVNFLINVIFWNYLENIPVWTSQVDFTSNENFLQFWNTNGQFLTWKLFQEMYPHIPAHLFDDFKNLSQRKQKDLEEKWDQGTA